jgi:hypothetical protein
VKSTIEADKMKLLEGERDPSRIFRFFNAKYDFHDAEVVFSWAAKAIMFHEERKDIDKMPPGPYWVKSKCAL